MQRRVFTEEQDDFRGVMREFLRESVASRFIEWEAAGKVPKEFYRELGSMGVLGMAVPEEYSGGGQDDYRFSAVLTEESMYALVNLGALRVHMDIVLPYFLRYATDEQKQRWLPGMASGDLMASIAITEPGTGSDVAGIRTSAERDGDDWVLNGSKTFITGGVNADLVLVVARTSPYQSDARRAGLSLFVVEADREGYSVGPNMNKLGLKAQDTAELFFSDVRVPGSNLLGDEGEAFAYLGHNLPQERLSIAVGSVASAHSALAATVEYTQERRAFGTPVSAFQNSKFVLAECATDIEAGQALIDRALDEHSRGTLSATDAAIVKLHCTELQARVVDKCLQLHGGYGYMMEYPIARLYADARVTRIYGGSSEIMKSIISKSLLA
ncbi:acyl-CoA dehydrogenase family protein [Aeromicrobium sp. Leaf350]|uniref:acyl-CoA dehydrogenase family protein n=1 Tax=Aeromicrobium sp. Leaf350 TaxID=2876565 RepID=UPI001E3BEF27|nr:acyl-CoA dehydrogenase family protein [Aeromicrobium sp. Leaf350]